MPTSEKEVETALEKLQSLNLKNLDTSTLLDKFVSWAIDSGVRLIIGLLIISIGFKIIKKVVNKFEHFLEKRDVDVTLRRFLKSFSIGGLKAIIVLLVVTLIWDVKLTGLVALFTSAGVAIGLALQGSLSNFAGGVMILIMKPFTVGDYIESNGVEGTVYKIDIFYTSLKTVDNKSVKLPNGTLSNSILTNYSMNEKRRVDVEVGIGYDDNIELARKELERVMNSYSNIMRDEANAVVVKNLADSAIIMEVRVWVPTEYYWDCKFYLNENIRVSFDKAGISIPFNQLDVNVHNVD